MLAEYPFQVGQRVERRSPTMHMRASIQTLAMLGGRSAIRNATRGRETSRPRVDFIVSNRGAPVEWAQR